MPATFRPPSDRRFDEPEVELVLGVELPKVSPRRRHALLQAELAERFRAWARGRGEVGTEWRFRLSADTSLVPDVAFVRYERLASLTDEQIEEPPFAPDTAIEIRSPGDRDRNVALKASLYRSAGARVVLDVDPDRQQIVALADDGSTTFAAGERFVHQSLPGLTIDVTELFATTRRH